MNSPQETDFEVIELRRDSNVRGEHELFDELMALVVLDFVSTDDSALFVEVEFHFRQVQIERTFRELPPSQRHRQRVQIVKKPPDDRTDGMRMGRRSSRRAVCSNDVFDLSWLGGSLALPDQRHHFFIREPLRDFDRRLGELGVNRDAIGGELDEGRIRVPHATLLQAGQTVRDDFRQHRQDARRQVDAGAAPASFAVQNAAAFHEMGDVGDVNSQHPMAGFVAFQRDRVVEVASVERVDGHDRVVRQVESASQIGFIEEFRLPSRFVQHFGRELVGEIELVDDRQQIDTRFALSRRALASAPLRRNARGTETAASR